MHQSASPALHKGQCPRPPAHYEQTECGDSVEPERNVVVIMSRCSVSLSLSALHKIPRGDLSSLPGHFKPTGESGALLPFSSLSGA